METSLYYIYTAQKVEIQRRELSYVNLKYNTNPNPNPNISTNPDKIYQVQEIASCQFILGTLRSTMRQSRRTRPLKELRIIIGDKQRE